MGTPISQSIIPRPIVISRLQFVNTHLNPVAVVVVSLRAADHGNDPQIHVSARLQAC
jgi:hypothetical protein